MSVDDDVVYCNFLRKSEKSLTFIYPNVKVEMSVKKSNIISIVKLLKVKRGHYNFGKDVYYNIQ